MPLTESPCTQECKGRRLGCRTDCEAFAAYEKQKAEEYRLRRERAEAEEYAMQQIRRWKWRALRDKSRGHG